MELDLLRPNADLDHLLSPVFTYFHISGREMLYPALCIN